MVRPELTQRVGDPRLDLEVLGHGVVLDDAEEAVGSEQPHQTTSMAKASSMVVCGTSFLGSCSSEAS